MPTQLTTLFPNDVLDRLSRLSIQSRSRRTSRARGEHLAGKGGTSTEFCDYRDYAPGDDPRFVDWNIFARLRRPYLKQYHCEEVRHVVLLVDASQSMTFDNKLARACQLAAAFGAVGLLNRERVSVHVGGGGTGEGGRFLLPCTGRLNLPRLFGTLEAVRGGGAAPLETAIDRLVRLHTGRGVCLVVSDFLTFGDLPRGLNALFSAGLEVFGIQVLSPAELEPDVAGDLRLVDSETDGNLDISGVGDLLSVYQEYRAAHEAHLATWCRQRAGRFLSVSSADPLESVLFDRCRRNGWLG